MQALQAVPAPVLQAWLVLARALEPDRPQKPQVHLVPLLLLLRAERQVAPVIALAVPAVQEAPAQPVVELLVRVVPVVREVRLLRVPAGLLQEALPVTVRQAVPERALVLAVAARRAAPAREDRVNEVSLECVEDNKLPKN